MHVLIETVLPEFVGDEARYFCRDGAVNYLLLDFEGVAGDGADDQIGLDIFEEWLQRAGGGLDFMACHSVVCAGGSARVCHMDFEFGFAECSDDGGCWVDRLFLFSAVSLRPGYVYKESLLTPRMRTRRISECTPFVSAIMVGGVLLCCRTRVESASSARKPMAFALPKASRR